MADSTLSTSSGQVYSPDSIQDESPREDRESQISLPTAIFIGIVCAIADVIDIFVGGIPIGDFIAFPITQIYLRIKGLRGTQMLIGNLIELIPLADIFPVRTAVWIFTAYADRHQKAAGAILKTASIAASAGKAARGKAIGAGGKTATEAEMAASEEAARKAGYRTNEKAAARYAAGSSPEDQGEREREFAPSEGPAREERRGTIEETPDTGEKSGRERTPRGAPHKASGLEELGWGTETKRVIETLEKTPGMEDIEGKNLQKEPRVRLSQDKNIIDLKNTK